ncbi:MAG: SMP-30/gluconolactonase/LRE family protein [Thermoanaerobaculia bacterium]
MRRLALCLAFSATPLVGLEGESSTTPASPPPAVQPATPAGSASGPQELFRQALEKRKAGDLPGYLAGIDRVASLLPDPSNLYYRLAGAQAITGHAETAIEIFRRMIEVGIYRDPRQDPDFAALVGKSRFTTDLERLERLKDPTAPGELAFSLDDSEFQPEGIAYDPATRAFFVSSVRLGKIVRRAADGKVSEFAHGGDDGPWSILGIAVDGERGLLWATSAALPNRVGLAKEKHGRSALFSFDLATGEPRRRFDAPEGEHGFNDLAIGPGGSVFVSDPSGHAVWVLAAGGTALAPLAPVGFLDSPNGLALSADRRWLYVSDYGIGLVAFDLVSQQARFLQPLPDLTTLGIDGLAWADGALVAIVNGIQPHRILRLDLAPDGRSIAGWKLLARNAAEWNEPTLGVVVGDLLYYVGNSQWGLFDENTGVFDRAHAAPPKIFRLAIR